MTTLDDIKRMQKEGRSEQQIIDTLQSQGVPKSEVYDALTQSKIRQAVSGAEPEETVGGASSQQYEGMQQSLTSEVPAPPAEQYPQAGGQEEYYAPQASYPQEGQYAQQQYNQTSESISEISEQIVAEKMSPLKNKLEKAIDLKTKVEAKMESVEERLKRIENIIDKLQISVLQKVGSYVNNVEDIKKEMVETQKSFKSLLEKKHAHKKK